MVLGQAVLPSVFQRARGYPGRAKRTERLPHQGFSTRKANGVAVRRETSLFGSGLPKALADGVRDGLVDGDVGLDLQPE